MRTIIRRAGGQPEQRTDITEVSFVIENNLQLKVRQGRTPGTFFIRVLEGEMTIQPVVGNEILVSVTPYT